jgi:hypothetical protein
VINYHTQKISLRMEGGRHHNRRKQTPQNEKVQKKKNKKPPKKEVWVQLEMTKPTTENTERIKRQK